MRLADILLAALGRRATWARGRLAYRVLAALVDPRGPAHTARGRRS